MESALQVLRQHGADSASHAPERRAAKLVGRSGKPEAYYFPPQYNQTRQQLSVHLHGSRARHDEGRRAALPRELEQGRQRHPESVARVPARARHRLADRSRHPARARFARHLRAAGEQRRVRDVSVRGRGPDRRLEPADQGRAAGAATTISTTSSSMLDWDANVNPRVREEQPRVPEAGAVRSPKPKPTATASSGSATAPAGTRRRS